MGECKHEWYEGIYYNLPKHCSKCQESYEVYLEEQIQQAQATIAAMREGLTMMRKHVLMYGKQKSDTGMIYDTCRQLLESTTAGAELLEKMERLEQDNMSLRCCGNCKEKSNGQWCSNSLRHECLKNNNHSHWVIAERLVKG